MKSILPVTKQAVGVRAAWSQPFQFTHERPRCSGDAGALGRHGGPASQKAGDQGNRGSDSDRDSVSVRGRGSGECSLRPPVIFERLEQTLVEPVKAARRAPEDDIAALKVG